MRDADGHLVRKDNPTTPAAITQWLLVRLPTISGDMDLKDEVRDSWVDCHPELLFVLCLYPSVEGASGTNSRGRDNLLLRPSLLTLLTVSSAFGDLSRKMKVDAEGNCK